MTFTQSDKARELSDIKAFLQEILRLKKKEYSKCTNLTELEEAYRKDRLESGNPFYKDLCKTAYEECYSKLTIEAIKREAFKTVKERIEEEKARAKAEEKARKAKYKRELPEIKKLSREINRKVCSVLETCKDCPGAMPGKGWYAIDCPKYNRSEDLGRLRVIYKWMNKE